MARHKEFEPDAALAEAMALFWEQGYEHTSMQDLVQRMGVHKRSMYDTFGDKHALFVKALDRYADGMENGFRAAIDEMSDARELVREIVENAIDQGSVRLRGCLLVNSSTEVAPRDTETAARIARNAALTRELMTELVTKGQRAGQIGDQWDAAVLTDLLLNSLTGLRVQVRAGVGRAQLERTAENILTLLD